MPHPAFTEGEFKKYPSCPSICFSCKPEALSCILTRGIFKKIRIQEIQLRKLGMLKVCLYA